MMGLSLLRASAFNSLHILSTVKHSSTEPDCGWVHECNSHKVRDSRAKISRIPAVVSGLSS